MTNTNLFQAMGRIDPKLIADAAPDSTRENPDNIIPLAKPQNGNIFRNKKYLRGIVAAVLALVIIAGGVGFLFNHNRINAVSSVISLDVNPSIELRANRDKTVLSCTAMNKDAVQILSDMNGGADLKGIPLNVAVNAVVGSMLAHGYLDGISSAIMISVEDNNQNRAANIREELVTLVDGILQSSSSQSAVYSQSMTIDTDLKDQAHNYNISSGKANLINRIIAVNGSLNFDALAALSIDELQDLLKIGAPGMPIGADAAAQAAQNYAGTAALDSDTVKDVDSELDDATPHYEVELYISGKGEFEYKVDAFTGKILSGKQNIAGSSSDKNASGSTTGTDSSAGQTSSAGSGTSDVGENAAKAAALNHAGLSESKVSRLKVERDFDDGRLEYEVEFYYNNTEYQYTIDAATGKVRGYETEPVKGTQSGGSKTGASGTTDIGENAAKAAALSHAGLSESKVSRLKVERDFDDGRLEYEVDFVYNGYEYEYVINAATGAILEHDVDRDD